MWDGPGLGGLADGAAARLNAREHAAAMELARQVRLRVPAVLEHALLFGSKARGQARPDSDVDVLLIWRHLPPDREPQAGQAEAIAEEVAARTGVPVGVWSVAMDDLDRGVRTPMLVDALDDALPLWPPRSSVPRVAFTPDDAVFCAARLLDRVRESEPEIDHSLALGTGDWVRRLRDDLVRLCTATLLLAGETRPRRGGAVRRFLDRNPRFPLSRADRAALAWAARSYPPGHLELDDASTVPPPPRERGNPDQPRPPPPRAGHCPRPPRAQYRRLHAVAAPRRDPRAASVDRGRCGRGPSSIEIHPPIETIGRSYMGCLIDIAH